jgi:hypothetical protein
VNTNKIVNLKLEKSIYRKIKKKKFLKRMVLKKHLKLTKIKSVKVKNKKLINQFVKPVRIRKMNKKEDEKRKIFELRPRNKTSSYKAFFKFEIKSNEDVDSNKWNPRVNLINLDEIINVKKFKTFSAKKVIKLINDRKSNLK